MNERLRIGVDKSGRPVEVERGNFGFVFEKTGDVSLLDYCCKAEAKQYDLTSARDSIHNSRMAFEQIANYCRESHQYDQDIAAIPTGPTQPLTRKGSQGIYLKRNTRERGDQIMMWYP